MSGPRVALAQLNSAIGDVSANLKRAQDVIQDAHKAGADVVLFPELYLQGYRADERFAETAIEVDGPVVAELVAMATEANLHIIMGTARGERTFPQNVYNAALLIGPKGLLGVYDKAHLATFRVYREGAFFARGRRIPTFDTDFGRIGIQICYDLDVPEVSRVLALQGAEINFVITAGTSGFREGWKKLLFVRSVENAMYSVFCNVAGTQKDSEFFGGSRIVGPSGEVVVTARDDVEDLVVGDVDLERVSQVRHELHPFDVRSPGLYGKIVEPLNND
jgi:beta-ureidopropionase